MVSLSTIPEGVKEGVHTNHTLLGLSPHRYRQAHRSQKHCNRLAKITCSSTENEQITRPSSRTFQNPTIAPKVACWGQGTAECDHILDHRSTRNSRIRCKSDLLRNSTRAGERMRSHERWEGSGHMCERACARAPRARFDMWARWADLPEASRDADLQVPIERSLPFGIQAQPATKAPGIVGAKLGTTVDRFYGSRKLWSIRINGPRGRAGREEGSDLRARRSSQQPVQPTCGGLHFTGRSGS
jgi:hypothetical protein